MKKNTLPNSNWIWWKHGVIYHIYPRSFYDTNGDGIGDLEGVVNKLDYIKKLGIDAIWLSPVYESPHVDFGYDISDYTKIDPVFGDIEIFKYLLNEAHARNIRVIMDLVLNHTSDKHPWFIESSMSKNNPKKNWYIWQNPENGKPPNNWKTSFGGTAWEFNSKRGQYYYHSFFKEQPDLNWRNNSLKNTFFEIIENWLKMGVDGFRLDVANFIIKDKKFRNNPGILGMLSGKKKIYTRNRPRSIKLLQELRALLDKYDDRMSVGEIFTLPPGSPSLSSKYLGGGNDTLHMTFDFSLIFKRWNAKLYAKTIERWNNAIPNKGWPCHVLSNHDLFRSYNRPAWRLFKHQKSIIQAFLLLTLRGTPFIYYGEEIGMQNTRVKLKNIKDPLGKRFWPFYLGRDKARTPMQWENKPNAGFTSGKPWLPVNKDYVKKNVDVLTDQDRSVYWYYCELLKIRKKYPVLQNGKWQLIENNTKGVMIYRRYAKDANFLVILNFRPFKKHVAVEEDGIYRVLFSTHKNPTETVPDHQLFLNGFEATILKK